MFNFDVPLLYRKICEDMADAQLESGLVPDIAPEYTVFGSGFRDSPEWGSACAVNPWLLYERYGDLGALAASYGVASRYAEYLGSQAKGHILSHGLGDWYDIGPRPPGESQLTSKGVTATAIYYRDLEILRRTATLLGRRAEADNWAAQAADVRRAFNDRFFKPATAGYDRGSQTANAMPLVLDLVPSDRVQDVLANLVRNVRERTNQVTAGDVGFRFLVEALRQGGRSDVLFDMVTRVDGPGYADQLRKGATTLTEAWDANPASSQNHCMLGHVEEWFYTGLAGINPDPSAAGFRKVIIAPRWWEIWSGSVSATSRSAARSGRRGGGQGIRSPTKYRSPRTLRRRFIFQAPLRPKCQK
jgi:alpha-L-rhamnosidase